MKTALSSIALVVLALFIFATPTRTADKAQDVNVINIAAVQDVDNPARSPFVANGSAQFSSEGHDLTVSLGTVPAGKRLVIEQVSVEVQGDTSEGSTQRLWAAVETTAGGNASRYTFIGADGGLNPDFSTVENFIAAAQIRSYADAGTAVSVEVNRKLTASCPCPANVSLSGYLVNVP